MRRPTLSEQVLADRKRHKGTVEFRRAARHGYHALRLLREHEFPCAVCHRDGLHETGCEVEAILSGKVLAGDEALL